MLIKDSQYSKLKNAFPELSGLISVHRLRNSISQLSGVQTKDYHCCVNSCILYYGPFATLQECPYCSEPRLNRHGRARHHFQYFPLIPRLVNMFLNKKLSESLRYRAKFKHIVGRMRDVYDGSLYQNLLNKMVSVSGEILPYYFFELDTDMAFGLTCDGFGPFKRRSSTCWPLLLINFNLTPSDRYKLDNVIPIGCIPGPKQMKDIDSFLLPFVEEMLCLARGVKAFDAWKEEYFVLHAFLLDAFGDIPAVAKMIGMKGVGALKPCRFCDIVGIRIPDSTNRSHYVPLSRPQDRDNEYNPYDLPLRTPEAFMRQANEVALASTAAEEKRLSKQYGVNRIPILSALSSMEFPSSFPPGFMHVLLENVLKGLLHLWTSEYKGLNEGDGEYKLMPTVQEAVIAGVKMSGDTMPSTYGCRVPDFTKEAGYFTAEAYSIWSLLLAIPLLHRRFRQEKYYDNFVKLVIAVSICLQLDSTSEQLHRTHDLFISFVLEFET